MNQEAISHLQNCYLISPPWGNNSLPKYQVAQFLRSPYTEKPQRCIGVTWLGDTWHYSFHNGSCPEYALSSTRKQLLLPKIPCRFAIASYVQVPVLLISKTLVVGIGLRREWWGVDWVAAVQTRRGNIILSQKDLEAIA